MIRYFYTKKQCLIIQPGCWALQQSQVLCLMLQLGVFGILIHLKLISNLFYFKKKYFTLVAK